MILGRAAGQSCCGWTPGRGGRVGASATQHVVQNLFRDTTRDVDVRETDFLGSERVLIGHSASRGAPQVRQKGRRRAAVDRR